MVMTSSVTGGLLFASFKVLQALSDTESSDLSTTLFVVINTSSSKATRTLLVQRTHSLTTGPHQRIRQRILKVPSHALFQPTPILFRSESTVAFPWSLRKFQVWKSIPKRGTVRNPFSLNWSLQELSTPPSSFPLCSMKRQTGTIC